MRLKRILSNLIPNDRVTNAVRAITSLIVAIVELLRLLR
jgi:hypothetical protein